MAAETYDEALRRLLVHEGGYSDHPSDPGGPTKFGITIHDYRRHVKPGAVAADVRAMRIDEARAIYRSKYWDALRCGELPAGVDYAVFDYGVNSGIGRSGKVLRRVLRLSDATHVVSDGVLAAARGRDAAALVEAICDERIAFLRRLKTWPVFGRGWDRRVAEVRAAALAMAARASPGAVAQVGPAPGKGEVPRPRVAQQASAAAVAAAGAAAAVEARTAGAGLAVAFAIAATAAVLATAAWLWWRRRQRRLQDAAVQS